MKTMHNKAMLVYGMLFLFLSPIFITPLVAKDPKTKVKNGIERVEDQIKRIIDQVGDKIENTEGIIQGYLDRNSWKGIIQGKASTGVATLQDLKLNDHKIAIVVRPGDQIEGSIKTFLDPAKCFNLSFYRVVIGIKGLGGQTTICNYPGFLAGESTETFTLMAPAQRGLYEIRFRPVERFTSGGALEAWYDDAGNEPGAETTIGLIYVM